MRTWAVLIALVAVGCGGGNAAAPTVTAPEPPASTAAVTGQAPATTEDRPELTFPATTASEVLALAGQRPAGVSAYQVDVVGSDTTPGVSYTVQIASDDSRARIHQTQLDGETWIGLDLGTNAVTYTCVAPTGQVPSCRDGDPDGEGARAAERISRVLGNDFVTNVFAPMTAQTTGVFVGNDNQAGVPVSCVASSQGGRLCVSRSGFITQISAAGVTALAQSVATDVTAADLDPPSQQQ
jgi:hypothetical protein